ncbi:MAG: V-type ATP synthase subunit E [Clostridia bacterium]|nr:V-type ATP synthase subunit E [Clostridia bacterium]
MEIQLQELIDQIKKEGVESAEKQAQEIIESAKAEAEKITANAQAQADKILENAKSENERFVKSGEDAIRQAGRNLLISFRESVSREMDAILNKSVNDLYASESLAQIIINAIEGWANKPDAENIEVILNSDSLNALEDKILAGIKEKMLSEVTLKANDNFDGGFRISVNNGTAYYDYSAEAVVEMLSNYLSPKITELLKEA